MKSKKHIAEIRGTYFMYRAGEITQQCYTGYHKEGEAGWHKMGTYIARLWEMGKQIAVKREGNKLVRE
jgi:hypothetical protein